MSGSPHIGGHIASHQCGATHHIDGVHWVEHSVQEDVVGGRLVRRCLVGVRCIAIRGPTWGAQTQKAIK